jgi:hypothetical protein
MAGAPLEGVFVPQPPSPNVAPAAYSSQYVNQANNQLKLYLSLLASNQLEIVKFINTLTDLTLLGKNNFDAFGRLRVSQPFTLFDSQNRYAADPAFDTSLTGSGTSTFLTNEAAVSMDVTTASGDKVIRQTKRYFPYQPGKSLSILTTFVMNAGKTNLRQRVGYFDTNNGVFLQRNETELSFIIRTYTGGSVDDTRKVVQSSWNGDKLDGSGASGITLDTTKAQIMFMDFEWLGVGSVRVGFVIDGKYITAHTFDNANEVTKVYMQTATLPMRLEIENTGTTASSSAMKQICSTVLSEGGYEQTSIENVARRTATLTGIGTTFVPLVSMRLASDSLGAIVLPKQVRVLPIANGEYEIALFRNATLTGASYDTTTFRSVDFDITATAMSGGDIVLNEYATSSNQSGAQAQNDLVYNFDMQLGATIAGTSDVYTVAVRILSGTGSAIGSLAFYDLTA